MLAFKNNQLNSRNEKIDDKESSELPGTDFFSRTNIRAYFCANISYPSIFRNECMVMYGY